MLTTGHCFHGPKPNTFTVIRSSVWFPSKMVLRMKERLFRDFSLWMVCDTLWSFACEFMLFLLFSGNSDFQADPSRFSRRKLTLDSEKILSCLKFSLKAWERLQCFTKKALYDPLFNFRSWTFPRVAIFVDRNLVYFLYSFLPPPVAFFFGAHALFAFP